MKNPITFVYVGGNLGVVGGYHEDPSKTLVRLTDYVELEAKLKRLAADSLHDLNHLGSLAEENATLKAELEALRGFCTRTIIPNDVLTAKVERLTKAGDAMADRLLYQGYPLTVPAWKAAKEDESK